MNLPPGCVPESDAPDQDPPNTIPASQKEVATVAAQSTWLSSKCQAHVRGCPEIFTNHSCAWWVSRRVAGSLKKHPGETIKRFALNGNSPNVTVCAVSGMNALQVVTCVDVHAYNLARPNEQRNPNPEPVVECRIFPITVVLRARGRSRY